MSHNQRAMQSATLLAAPQQRMHNACMPSLSIRDVPPETRDELAARAARAGQSLQAYLRAQLIELARRPPAGEVIARARARVEMTGTQLSATRIVEHRDADRT